MHVVSFEFVFKANHPTEADVKKKLEEIKEEIPINLAYWPKILGNGSKNERQRVLKALGYFLQRQGIEHLFKINTEKSKQQLSLQTLLETGRFEKAFSVPGEEVFESSRQLLTGLLPGEQPPKPKSQFTSTTIQSKPGHFGKTDLRGLKDSSGKRGIFGETIPEEKGNKEEDLFSLRFPDDISRIEEETSPLNRVPEDLVAAGNRCEDQEHIPDSGSSSSSSTAATDHCDREEPPTEEKTVPSTKDSDKNTVNQGQGVNNININIEVAPAQQRTGIDPTALLSSLFGKLGLK